MSAIGATVGCAAAAIASLLSITFCAVEGELQFGKQCAVRKRLGRAIGGPGIRQRITDSNNSGNKIYLDISPKGIRVYWRLKETKGFWQSLTGEKEEKLTYSQLGLTPPPAQQQPDGYWGFLQWWAEDAILADESIDMAYTAGGFVMGRQHGLL